MRARILDAALRVLREDGALAFTTTRVAEEAGSSVGSLYQYFPNKHAIVVAIHRDAVDRGWEHVRGILDHPRWAPRRRILEIAKWFFATESSEAAELGAVFEDIEVFMRDDTGQHELDRQVLERFERFLREHSPMPRSAAVLTFDAQLLVTTLESVGKSVATQQLAHRERDRWATAIASMLCEHLAID